VCVCLLTSGELGDVARHLAGRSRAKTGKQEIEGAVEAARALARKVVALQLGLAEDARARRVDIRVGQLLTLEQSGIRMRDKEQRESLTRKERVCMYVCGFFLYIPHGLNGTCFAAAMHRTS
jgi:hypothetical protein